jgi:hypothetical protein
MSMVRRRYVFVELSIFYSSDVGNEQTTPARLSGLSDDLDSKGFGESLVNTSEGRSTSNINAPERARTVISHRKILIAKTPIGRSRS